jgi:hypothetical protein
MISRRRDRNQNQGHGQGINLVTNLADAVDGDSVGRRAAAYPVTPDEISKMWHEAAKRGPHPDMQRCADLAAYISRLMPEFRRQVQVWRTPGRALPPNAVWSPAERNELRDAINQLRRAADQKGLLGVRNGYRAFLAGPASPLDALPCASIILWFD